MLHLKSFTFNPFQENTYVLYDDTRTAFIFDPGNSDASENAQLSNFVAEKQLHLKRLLLTHAHVDHVMGNRFIFDTYGLLPEVHKEELFFIDRMPQTAAMYGVNCDPSPQPENFLEDGDVIELGKYKFECILAPGHSPGSICFYNADNKMLIGGDVLFNGSIGRTDLPKGDHDTLLKSVRERLYTLPENVKVFPGHGPSTTIGYEKENNPFVRG